MGGRISAALEQEVRNYARQRGTVVWLDAEGAYIVLTDDLRARHKAGDFPIPVVGFRGSFLELLLALDAQTGGLENTPLVVHMPGFNQSSILRTPVLELYEAGKQFQKALPTLVTEVASGIVPPDALTAFLKSDGLTLEAADTWLETQVVRAQGGWAAYLEQFSLPALVQELVAGQWLHGHVTSAEDRAVLWDHIHRRTGLDANWRAFVHTDDSRLSEVGHATIAWALAVEYVHDLHRAPFAESLTPLRSLAKPLVEACTTIAKHLRSTDPERYIRSADELEALLHVEQEQGRPEDLGRIDTFRFEEALVYRAALEAIEKNRWQAVLDWAVAREGDGSFWVQRDLARRAAWTLVGDAARLGLAIAEAGRSLEGVQGLEEAVLRYMRTPRVVDQAHRLLEQRRTALLDPRLPHFGDLRSRLDDLRERYRRWADELARDFSALCRQHGFLGTESLQQRELFEQVVRPIALEEGPVALFMVDALRYEMAEALRGELRAEAGSSTDLRARLAELPSVTEIGMNALAPVARNGRLQPIQDKSGLGGFRTQEFQVKDPDSRRRMMHSRVGGDTCPLLSLAEVLDSAAKRLKKSVARAKLVVVHSTEIDDAGEKGLGLATFETTLRQLRAACRLLRDAGIQRFVFTADHGFLLLDETTREDVSFGRKTDPSRRHAIYPAAVVQPGQVSVSLSSLGYDGVTGYLMFPEDTSVYDTGKKSRTFVHGGNSLQERVIPVLTVRYRGAAGSGTVRFGVQAEALEGIAGMHCIRVQVAPISEQIELAFGAPKEVELALRALDRPDVTVELCDVRGAATLRGAAIRAQTSGPFELFFKLLGTTDDLVQVKVFHPAAAEDVAPAVLERRFAVTRVASTPPAPAPVQPPAAPVSESWLEDLGAEGARKVFGHLSQHGAITEAEATAMLGGARAFRKFSREFEALSSKVPFRTRIEVMPSGKRYVREGEGSLTCH